MKKGAVRGFSPTKDLKKRRCEFCNSLFQPYRVHHMFCSRSHAQQYEKGSNWEVYFKRQISSKASKRTKLKVKHLVDIFKEQNGLCALSGVELTKIVGKGQVTTNASIDRINPGKAYTKNNIRLVCNFINGLRSNLSDSEFVWWCSQVHNKHGK